MQQQPFFQKSALKPIDTLNAVKSSSRDTIQVQDIRIQGNFHSRNPSHQTHTSTSLDPHYQDNTHPNKRMRTKGKQQTQLDGRQLLSNAHDSSDELAEDSFRKTKNDAGGHQNSASSPYFVTGKKTGTIYGLGTSKEKSQPPPNRSESDFNTPHNETISLIDSDTDAAQFTKNARDERIRTNITNLPSPSGHTNSLLAKECSGIAVSQASRDPEQGLPDIFNDLPGLSPEDSHPESPDVLQADSVSLKQTHRKLLPKQQNKESCETVFGPGRNTSTISGRSVKKAAHSTRAGGTKTRFRVREIVHGQLVPIAEYQLIVDTQLKHFIIDCPEQDLSDGQEPLVAPVPLARIYRILHGEGHCSKLIIETSKVGKDDNKFHLTLESPKAVYDLVKLLQSLEPMMNVSQREK